MSLADELERLNQLHASGGLTDEEFSKAKDRLLSAPQSASSVDSSASIEDSLGQAANRYVTHQAVFGVIGMIVFLMFLMVFLRSMGDRGEWVGGFSSSNSSNAKESPPKLPPGAKPMSPGQSK